MNSIKLNAKFLNPSISIALMLVVCWCDFSQAECSAPDFGNLGDKLATGWVGNNTIIGDYATAEEAIAAVMGGNSNCLASNANYSYNVVDGCNIKFASRVRIYRPEVGCSSPAHLFIATVGVTELINGCLEPNKIKNAVNPDYPLIIKSCDDFNYRFDYFENNYGPYAKVTVYQNYLSKIVMLGCACWEFRYPIEFSDSSPDGINYSNYPICDPERYIDAKEKEQGKDTNKVNPNCGQNLIGAPH